MDAFGKMHVARLRSGLISQAKRIKGFVSIALVLYFQFLYFLTKIFLVGLLLVM